MKFIGTISTEMSGSLGGITASRNRGGAYFRQRVTPTNPNSTKQSQVRTIVQFLSDYWTNTLTQPQRDAWDNYNLQTPGFVGTGIDAFIRCNIPRLYWNALAATEILPLVVTAPAIFDVGSFSPIALGVVDASASTAIFAFTDTDEWANEDESAMLIYGSPPVNASRTNYFGLYNLFNIVIGDAVTPPTSPNTTANYPFTLTAGQRIFLKVRVSRADGRLASPQRVTGLVTA